MTSISAAGAAVPVIVPAVATDQVAAVTQPASANSGAAVPQDVVSLGAAASAVVSPATAAAPLPSMDPTQVENALARVGGANGLAYLATHFAYDVAVATFGQKNADSVLSQLRGAATNAAAPALATAQSLGIPVQVVSKAPDPSDNPDSPTTRLTVSAFSFTNAGSTYTVTPQADGTLKGTKDGQYWTTWQLQLPPELANVNAGASTALQVLSSAAGSQSRALNLSA